MYWKQDVKMLVFSRLVMVRPWESSYSSAPPPPESSEGLGRGAGEALAGTDWVAQAA